MIYVSLFNIEGSLNKGGAKAIYVQNCAFRYMKNVKNTANNFYPY